MKKYLVLSWLMAFAGCSTIQAMYTDYPKQVATLEAGLAAAEHTALIYVSFPVCGKTSAVLCRTPSITAKIGAADQAAYIAIEAARQAEDQTSIEAAKTAVDAFTSIVNGLPSKGV